MVRPLVVLLPLMAACAEEEPLEQTLADRINIVDLVLSYSDPRDANREPPAARWIDPPGTAEPEVQPLVLDQDTSYSMDVFFRSGEADDPEDLTEEIREISEEYQLFFTGISVESPATGKNPFAVITQAYDDRDRRSLPVGLQSVVETRAKGSGPLTVTLFSIPTGSDQLFLKEDDFAESVASRGSTESLPGSDIISVEFVVEVQ